MDPLNYFGTVFFVFAMFVFAAGILGRGWFLWVADDREGKPRS